MNDQIVSRATMFARGEAAFAAGHSRDSHGMNSWAPAVPDWLAGYDHAAQVWHEQQQGGHLAGAGAR